MPPQWDSSLRLPAGGHPARREGRRVDARLEILGGFALHINGAASHQPPHVQRLLAFLALHRRPLQRSFVSGRLWPELTQEHAFGCLRTTLWRVDKRSDLLDATSTDLAIRHSVEVDATELETCADAILMRGGIADSAGVHRLVRAAQLLPDWYDDWVLEERDRLAQLRVLALELAADDLLVAGSFQEAALAAKAAVRADPLRESATRVLIRVHLAAGNQGEALREYRAFQARLARDLALQPGPETTELVRALPDVADGRRSR